MSSCNLAFYMVLKQGRPSHFCFTSGSLWDLSSSVNSNGVWARDTHMNCAGISEFGSMQAPDSWPKRSLSAWKRVSRLFPVQMSQAEAERCQCPPARKGCFLLWISWMCKDSRVWQCQPSCPHMAGLILLLQGCCCFLGVAGFIHSLCFYQHCF